MGRLEKLKIDMEASVEGNLITLTSDIKFRVARWMNPRHREAFEALTRNRKQEILNSSLPREDEERIIAISMARGVITGWENLQDDDGVDIPYNIQNCEKLLRDPAMCWVVEFVKEYSQDQENYRLAALEEDSGN